MVLYADNVVDRNGNAIPGAQVLVLNSLGGTATITTSAGVASPNPFSADSGGRFSFMAAAGNYSLVITSGTHSTRQGILLQDVFQIITPQMFGAVADDNGTTGTDNLAAFNAAIAYLKTLGIASNVNVGTPALKVPHGNYYLSDTWEIKGVTVIIEGEGVGQEGGNATTLRWPASKCGIRVHRYNTITNTTQSPTTTGSDGTIIRNLNLQGGGGTANADYSGIWVRCRVKITDVRVTGFAGHGILFRATQGSGTPAQEGNANCWRLDSCRLKGNGKSGYALVGADVNAGIATGVDTSNNAEYGIDDGSFLGNTHHGLHSEANTLGAYRNTDNNAFCWFDGYTESGQPGGSLGPNSIGSGPQFAGVTGTGTFLRGSGLSGSGLQASNGFNAMRTKADNVTILKHVMGPDPVNNEYDLFTAPDTSTYGFANFSNDWGIQVSSLIEALRVKSGFTTETFGRATNSSTKGRLQLPGFWLGAGSNARAIGSIHATDLASAITASSGQEVARGDHFYFDQPSAGGKLGVVCTTGGIIGSTAVLKAFGAIDA